MINDIKNAIATFSDCQNSGTSMIFQIEQNGLSDVFVKYDVPWSSKYDVKSYLLTVPNHMTKYLPRTCNLGQFKSFLHEFFCYMVNEKLWDHCQITEDFLLGHS